MSIVGSASTRDGRDKKELQDEAIKAMEGVLEQARKGEVSAFALTYILGEGEEKLASAIIFQSPADGPVLVGTLTDGAINCKCGSPSCSVTSVKEMIKGVCGALINATVEDPPEQKDKH